MLCLRCAKSTPFWTRFPPNGQGDGGNHRVPIHGTAPDSCSVHNSHNAFKQTVFHTENARMLSVFYLNLLCLPCECMLPWWYVVFRVVTGKLAFY